MHAYSDTCTDICSCNPCTYLKNNFAKELASKASNIVFLYYQKYIINYVCIHA